MGVLTRPSARECYPALGFVYQECDPARRAGQGRFAPDLRAPATPTLQYGAPPVIRGASSHGFLYPPRTSAAQSPRSKWRSHMGLQSYPITS